MAIDIRNLPTFYINCPGATDKNERISIELTDHGFVNFRRFNGIECRDGRAGCFLSHARCAFEAYRKESSEYILILEDDCSFNNVDNINAAINRAINEFNAFDVFTITTANDVYNNNTLHKPPKQNTWLTHFLLYRRVSIPSVLERFYHKWLTLGVLDAWGPSDVETVVFCTTDCIQNNSLPSSINHLWDAFVIIVNELDGCNAKDIIYHHTGKYIAYSDIATYIACAVTDNSLSLIVNDKKINDIHISLDHSITIQDIIRQIVINIPHIRCINLWNTGKNTWMHFTIGSSV